MPEARVVVTDPEGAVSEFTDPYLMVIVSGDVDDASFSAFGTCPEDMVPTILRYLADDVEGGSPDDLP